MNKLKAPATIVSVIMLVSMFVMPANAASVMVQETGTSFNSSFTKYKGMYEIGSSVQIGTMKYSFQIRSLLSDLDTATCICEHDYPHYSCLVIGIGTGNSHMYSSNTLRTHGNATISKAHKGNGTSYGATIDVS